MIVTCQELKAELDSGARPVLLDCREQWEYDVVHFPDSVLIPVNQLGMRWRELDTQADTVVYCHHGIRSLGAVGLLKRLGFQSVRSLEGGIEQWALAIEPSLPRY